MKMVVLILVVLLGNTTLRANDGTAWRALQHRSSKTFYVEGLMSGMMQCKVDETGKALTHKDVFGDIQPSQIVDGLDRLYDDFRNRNITVSAAISPVLMAIRGEPQEQIAVAVQSLRNTYSGP